MNKNEKISMTVRDRSGLLYIFENKEGKRIAYDGLRAFAKTANIDVNNLWRTYVKNKLNKTYWVNSKWRLVDRIDLTKPDWKEISRKLKNCKIINRIEKKLEAIERNLLSVRLYGHFTHKIVRVAKSMVAGIQSVVTNIKEDFDNYREEKKVEKSNYFEQRYIDPDEERKERRRREREYEDQLEQNARMQEGAVGYC